MKKQRLWMKPGEEGSYDVLPKNVVKLDGAPSEIKLSAKIIEMIDPWIGKMDLTKLANSAALALLSKEKTRRVLTEMKDEEIIEILKDDAQ